MYIQFLLYAGALFAIFRIVAQVVKMLPLRKKWLHLVRYLFPIVEFAVWLGFIIWIITFLLEESFIYRPLAITSVIVGMLLFAWFVLKDFLSGLIFKVQSDLKISDRIKINNIPGRVIALDYLSAQFETENGEVEIIPFSELRNRTIVKPGIDYSYSKELITYSCIKTANLKDTKEALRKKILNCPYCLINFPPEFYKETENDGECIFEVYVYVLNKSQAELVLLYLADK